MRKTNATAKERPNTAPLRPADCFLSTRWSCVNESRNGVPMRDVNSRYPAEAKMYAPIRYARTTGTVHFCIKRWVEEGGGGGVDIFFFLGLGKKKY